MTRSSVSVSFLNFTIMPSCKVEFTCIVSAGKSKSKITKIPLSLGYQLKFDLPSSPSSALGAMSFQKWELFLAQLVNFVMALKSSHSR